MFPIFKTVQWFSSYVYNSILLAQPPCRLSAPALDCSWTLNKELHGQSVLSWLPPDHGASTSAFQDLWPDAPVVPAVLSYGSLLRNSQITWCGTVSSFKKQLGIASVELIINISVLVAVNIKQRLFHLCSTYICAVIPMFLSRSQHECSTSLAEFFRFRKSGSFPGLHIARKRGGFHNSQDLLNT